MKKIKSLLFEDIGIILCILFLISFIFIVVIVSPYLNGASWYFFSSFQRIIFGLIELYIFIKIFHKERWQDVINFRHFKPALIAGSGIILYTIFMITLIIIGVDSLKETTLSLLFLQLIAQQATTGFWEELTCRAFVLEGYFKKMKKTWLKRLVYACITFIIFGLSHALNVTNMTFSLNRFVFTGTIGFAYAAIYLYSHNILVPMLLHFIYDIPANFFGYVEIWNYDNKLFKILNNYGFDVGLILIMVISLIFIIKKPVYEHKNINNEGEGTQLITE